MSAKLRAIRDESPSEPVVSVLEELLDRARKGEIRGLVVAYDAKGAMGHAMAWGTDVIPMALVGELHLAQFSVLVEAERIKPPE